MLSAAPFFGLIAAFMTGVGLFLVACFGNATRRYADSITVAAGGMLLTLTLLHIAPAALMSAPQAAVLILLGFMIGLFLQTVLRSDEASQSDGPASLAGLAPLIAIALHSFIDGALYTATFAGGFQTGLYAVSGLILHEVPEAFIAFAIVRQTGRSARSAALLAFLTAGLTTPLGAFASAPLIALAGAEIVPIVFAVSAGLLVYIATGPLLAPLRTQPRRQGLASLGAGVVGASLLLMAPLPHGGGDHGHGHVHAHFHDGRDLPNFSPFPILE